MAAVTASQVTINDTWWESDRWGKSKWLVKDVTLNLSSQGGATNYIGADVLGFSQIDQSSPAIADGNVLFLTSPSYAKDKVLVFNLAQATDASRDDPADITDIVRLTVKGKEA